MSILVQLSTQPHPDIQSTMSDFYYRRECSFPPIAQCGFASSDAVMPICQNPKSIFMFAKRTLLICVIICIYAMAHSQTYTIRENFIRDCSGNFTDSNPNGPYGNNEDFTAVICSDNATGSHIKLEFASANLGIGDTLFFYDDDKVNPNRLLAHNYEFYANTPFNVQASALNNTGCLTVVFRSDGLVSGDGWNASILCARSCQLIEAIIVNTDPVVTPLDTGWIDICPGDEVSFSGTGNFPQDGLFYPQSDATSTFRWDFGDGTLSNGQDVSHIFEEPGGYIVNLTIVDQTGCINSNFVRQRVRVAPPPSFGISSDLDLTICAKDTLQLAVNVNGSNPNAPVSVMSGTETFETGGMRSDSLGLPDGTGTSYLTSIEITGFDPGQVLNNINDLENICVNIEHSWMRDLGISIKCPNGSQVELHNHPGNVGGKVFLGEPIPNDGTNPTPGIGYDYCWTPTSTNDTWIGYSNDAFGLFGDGILPAGDYSSYENLNRLQGCPLNGEWTISVTDWWARDNGFIFSWSIDFASHLYPNLETFSPPIIATDWIDNSSVFHETVDSLLARPDGAGSASYTFEVIDGNACRWDTTILFQVLPETHPDCYDCKKYTEPLIDTMVCEGNNVQLDASPLVPLDFPVKFEILPNAAIGFDNYPPATPYEAIIDVNHVNPTVLTNPSMQIESICIDIETDFLSDLQVSLSPPGTNTSMLLTANNGTNGNYNQTCFTPSSTNPIASGSGDFTGDFSPEGDWDELTNFDVNGEWTLLVGDAAGADEFGVINGWSITFSNQVDITYSWSNPAILSCNDCPNPTVDMNQPTSLTLTTTDNFNCTFSDEVDLDFFTAPSPVLNCAAFENGEITLDWQNSLGADYYEINIDGQGWVQVNDTEYSFGNFNNGDISDIEIRSYFSDVDCYSLVGGNTCQYVKCEVQADPQTTLASCNNGQDGTVRIQAANTFGNTEFSLDGNNYQTNNLFEDLPEGDFTAYVQDELGCGDTILFSIASPPTFDIEFDATDVRCFGDNNGTATARTVGGLAPFDYEWNDPLQQQSQTASNLAANSYSVTVTDANNCEVIDQVTISQPDEIQLSLNAVDVLCFGDSTGSVSVNAMGGIAPFEYKWNDRNDQTTPMATEVLAGTFTVTVTDENDCEMTDFIMVGQPASAVTISPMQTDISCFGSDKNGATVTAIGGTGTNYQYIWENGHNGQNISNLTAGDIDITVEDENGCKVTETLEIETFDPIDISLLIFAPTCNGGTDGSIGINNIGGGSGLGYQINWSTGDQSQLIENLQGATSYDVRVTDSENCQTDSTVFLPQPDSLEVFTTVEDADCFDAPDGSATVTNLSGGASIQSYQWSTDANNQTTPTAENLKSGFYQVTVTNIDGCDGYQTVFVDEPSPIRIEGEIEDNVCFGDKKGTIEVTAEGGTPGAAGSPYRYLWDINQSGPKIEQLGAGNYMVSVVDSNNCSQMEIFTVEESPAIDVTLEVDSVNCAGGRDGSVLIDATGGTPPYRYSLDNDFFTGSNNLIGLTANDYQVTVKDRFDCIWFEDVTIGEPPVFEVDAGPDFVEVDLGDSVTIFASSNSNGTVDYEWDPAYDGILTCEFCDSTQAFPMVSTFVTLYGEDANGCSDTDIIEIRVQKERTVLVPTGFTPNNDGNNDLLLVHGKNETIIKLFRVYDRWGELVYEARDFEINDPNTGWNGEFRSQPMTSGVYTWYLEVEYMDGAIDNHRGQTTLIR